MPKTPKKCSLALFPLALAALALGGCSDPTTSQSSQSGESSSSPDSSSGQSGDSASGELLRGLRQSQGLDVLDSQGTTKALVVPFNFLLDDAPFQFTGLDSMQMNTQIFGSETAGTAAYYLNAASSGAFGIEGTVTLPAQSETAWLDFFQDAYNSSAEEAYANLVSELLPSVLEESPLSEYDQDGDGNIDCLILVNPFPEFNGYWTFGDETIDRLGAALLTTNVLSDVEGANRVGIITGNTSSSYYQDKDVTNRVINLITSMLGLPDYTDQTGSLEGSMRAPLGYSDPSEGVYADLNPFSKYLLGWSEPTVVYADELSGSTTVSLTANGAPLLVAPSETGIFGEYLLIDSFAPSGLNASSNFTAPGVRIYKIDSRLVSGNGDYFYLDDFASGEFEDGLVYDFAYSNSSYNLYSIYGIGDNFALCELLDATGANRHMANPIVLGDDALFHEGDVFGGESEFAGFYEDFRFDGNGVNGPELGLTIEVESVGAEGASLLLTAK